MDRNDCYKVKFILTVYLLALCSIQSSLAANGSVEENEVRFDKASAYYDDGRPKYPKEIFEYIKKLTKSKDSIVEIGCGNCSALLSLASSYTHAFCVDKDHAMLQACQRKIKKSNCGNIELINQDGMEFLSSNKNESIDLVVFARSLHYFNQSKIISTVFHKLRKGGALVIIIDDPSFWQRKEKIFQESYKLIDFIGEIKGEKFVRSGGKDGALNGVLSLLKKGKFNPVDVKYFSSQEIWDIEKVKSYFYSSCNYLNWLGNDSELFESTLLNLINRDNSLKAHGINVDLAFKVIIAVKP
mmetsp:Transcript_9880/g.22812  ORF Transcript_9880/g.22812 Transcript_9880/m.22812 type:complete len:299 (-) Transcript_9880:1405-2301(-)